MKKKGCVFISVLLVLTSLFAPAATAATRLPYPAIREDIPEFWQESYTNSRGETVEVDIPIRVPDVDTLPVLIVDKTEPFPEDRFTEYLDRKKAANDEYGWFIRNDRGTWCISENDRNSQLEYKGTAYHASSVLTDFDWDQPYAENNDLTVRDAYDILLEKFYTYMDDDIELELNRIVLNGRVRKYNSRTEELSDPLSETGQYVFDCWQLLEGIPLLDISYNAYKKNQTNREGSMFPPPFIRGGVRSEDEYDICAFLRKIREVRLPDMPMCSFETVKKQIEKAILWDDEKFPAWISQILINECRTIIRTKVRSKYDLLGDEALNRIEAYHEEDEFNDLRIAVGSLPETMKSAVAYPCKDIAFMKWLNFCEFHKQRLRADYIERKEP